MLPNFDILGAKKQIGGKWPKIKCYIRWTRLTLTLKTKCCNRVLFNALRFDSTKSLLLATLLAFCFYAFLSLTNFIGTHTSTSAWVPSRVVDFVLWNLGTSCVCRDYLLCICQISLSKSQFSNLFFEQRILTTREFLSKTKSRPLSK